MNFDNEIQEVEKNVNRPLRFITGMQPHLLDDFRPFTVDWFYRELEKMCDFGIEKLKEMLARKYPSISFEEFFTCTVEYSYNNKKFSKTISPFFHYGFDNGKKRVGLKGSEKEIIDAFHDKRTSPTDSVRRIVNLYSDREFSFINAYDDGSPMIRMFVNKESSPNFDIQCGKNHIIIQFLTPNEGRVGNDNTLKQNIDTHFYVTNFDEWIESNKTIELKGGVSLSGPTPLLLDEFWSDRIINALHKENKLDTNFDYAYVMLPEEYLGRVIFDKLRQMSHVRGTKLKLPFLKEAINATLKEKILIKQGGQNRELQEISRLRIIPKAQVYDSQLKLWKLVNKPNALSKEGSGAHMFNIQDKDFRKKSFSDIFSDENVDIELIRNIRIKYRLNYVFTPERQMQNNIFSINSKNYYEFLNRTKYAERFNIEMNSETSYDTQMFVKFEGDIDKCFEQYGLDGFQVVETLKNKFNSEFDIWAVAKDYDLFLDIRIDQNKIVAQIGTVKKGCQREKLEHSRSYELVFKNNKYSFSGLEFEYDKVYLSSKEEKFFTKDPNSMNLLVGFIESSLPKFIWANGEKIDTSMCNNFEDFKKIINADVYASMTSSEVIRYHKIFEGIGGSIKINPQLIYKNAMVVPKRTETISAHPSMISKELKEVLKRIDMGEIVTVDFSKNEKLVTHYEVNCPKPSCGNRSINVSAWERIDQSFKILDSIEETIPETENFICTACGHRFSNEKIGAVKNQNDVNYNFYASVKKHYLGSKKRNLNKIEILSYSFSEEGLALKVNCFYPMSTTRFAGMDLIKSLALGCNQRAIGFVKELKIKNPDSDEVKIFKDLPLSALVPANALKSKEVGIGISQVRLTNAVFNTKYEISKYLNGKNSEIFDLELKEINNKILKHVEKSEVDVEVYDYEKDIFLVKRLNIYVGLASVVATEVVQENAKTKGIYNTRMISKVDADMYNQLGMHDLVDELYNHVTLNSFAENHSANLAKELLYTYGLLTHPMNMQYSEAEKNKMQYWNKFSEKVTVYNPLTMNYKDLFTQDLVNRINLTTYIPASDYQKLLMSHPLLMTLPSDYMTRSLSPLEQKALAFQKGFIIDIVLRNFASQKEMKYRIRFPSRQLMLSLVQDKFNGSMVQLNDLFVAYLKLYEVLCAYKYEDGKLYWAKDNEKVLGNDTAIKEVVKAIESVLMLKEGKFNKLLSINMLAFQAKQTASVHVPYGTVIVGDKKLYEKMILDYLTIINGTPLFYELTGDQELESIMENGIPEGLLYVPLYGLRHRDPAAFAKQFTNVVRVISSALADKEFKEAGKPGFFELFPNFDGIMLNSIQMVRDGEDDEDGDISTVGIPCSPDPESRIHFVLEKWWKHFSDDPIGYYRVYAGTEKDVENLAVKKSLSDLGRESTYDYMMGEAKGCYSKYAERLKFNFRNSIVPNDHKNMALEYARDSKGDIGKLTSSMWFMNYLTSFLLYKKFNSGEPKMINLKLNNNLRNKIMFVFQYIILQLNGTRGIKSDGSYSRLTFDTFVRNNLIKVISGWGLTEEINARILFLRMLKEYDEVYHTNIANDVYDSLVSISDNFMIDNQTGFGGEYFIRDEVVQKMSIYNQKDIKVQIDQQIDKHYQDMLGIYMAVNGRSFEGHIQTYGKTSLYRGLLDEEYLNSNPVKNIFDYIPAMKHLADNLRKIFR